MHKRDAITFILSAFGIVVALISSVTTFGFFFTYFSGIIPSLVLDPYLSALLSGVMGVILFDLATVVWLFSFLYSASSSEQRAISLSLVVVTFIGAASASIAYLGLTATGELALDASTKDTIGLIALVVVIGGIVINFAASLMYLRYDPATKLEVRESDRKDRIQKAQEIAELSLDKEVAVQVAERIAVVADDLAARQAQALSAGFYGKESSKFKAQSSAKTCLYCGKPVDGERKKYCDVSCRQAYHRKQRS